MNAIEPNWISLLWFAAFATLCTIAFLLVAGMFPLRSRPASARSSARQHYWFSAMPFYWPSF
jgi:hypothetical protein